MRPRSANASARTECESGCAPGLRGVVACTSAPGSRCGRARTDGTRGSRPGRGARYVLLDFGSALSIRHRRRFRPRPIAARLTEARPAWWLRMFEAARWSWPVGCCARPSAGIGRSLRARAESTTDGRNTERSPGSLCRRDRFPVPPGQRIPKRVDEARNRLALERLADPDHHARPVEVCSAGKCVREGIGRLDELAGEGLVRGSRRSEVPRALLAGLRLAGSEKQDDARELLCFLGLGGGLILDCLNERLIFMRALGTGAVSRRNGDGVLCLARARSFEYTAQGALLPRWRRVSTRSRGVGQRLDYQLW